MKTGTCSDETKSKIRNTLIKYYEGLSVEHNEEIRRKISENTKKGMKNVPYEKLAYWKGKHHSEEAKNKDRVNNQITKRKLAKEYKEYKNSGGLLLWNEWNHERKLNAERSKH